MSEKITLADQIYADIKKDITNKQLVSGEKINIKELARKYGVSDTPVKQALQRLAEEKLVVNTPNKGMSVRTLTPHELNDTFDIRLMMDTFFIKDIITTLNYNSTLPSSFWKTWKNRNSLFPAMIPLWTQKAISSWIWNSMCCI